MNCKSQKQGGIESLLTATDSVRAAHARLVVDLEKPASCLLSEWSARTWKVGMLHGAIGVAGEIGEIVSDILGNNIRSLVKELGDACFYSSLVTLGIKEACAEIGIPAPDGVAVDFRGHDFVPPRDLQIHSSNLIDAVKQLALYGRDITPESEVSPRDFSELVLAIHQANAELQFALIYTGAGYGFSVNDILQGNIDKLSARYPSGTYTDQHAKERLDEAPAGFCGSDECRAKLIDQLRGLNPTERVDRLRRVKYSIGDSSDYLVFDVKSGVTLCALEIYGPEFGKITYDEISEKWEAELPGGLDLSLSPFGAPCREEEEGTRNGFSV